MALAKNKEYDKKTGRVKTKSAAAVKRGKKAARKRGHRKLSALHASRISKALKHTYKTGKTKAGRKRKKAGRKPGFSHSKATRARMSAAHKAIHRMKKYGHRYAR